MESMYFLIKDSTHHLRDYTPGRGKLVPRKYNVIIETFDYFGMAYRDSDYTVVMQ